MSRQAIESSAQEARRQAPRGWLPIALGGVAGIAVCALGAVALLLLRQPTPDPAPAARAICADLTTQRYDSLYEMLTPELQTQGTQAQFVASQRELDRLLGPVRTCKVSEASASGASAAATLALQRTHAATAHVALAQTSAGWRLASYDQTL